MNQEIIENLKSILKIRLCAQMKERDMFSNDVYIELYSDEQLTAFLKMSTSNLKLLLSLSEEDLSQERWTGLIIQGAVIPALASKAILERGKEFTSTDDSLSFQPPNVSSLLMRQWEVELSDYTNKISMLKVYK